MLRELETWLRILGVDDFCKTCRWLCKEFSENLLFVNKKRVKSSQKWAIPARSKYRRVRFSPVRFHVA